MTSKTRPAPSRKRKLSRPSPKARKKEARQIAAIEQVIASPLLSEYTGPTRYIDTQEGNFSEIAADAIRSFKANNIGRHQKSARIRQYEALGTALDLYLLICTWPLEIRTAILKDLRYGKKTTKKAGLTHILLRTIIEYPSGDEARKGDYSVARDAGALEEAIAQKLTGPEFIGLLKQPKSAGISGFYNLHKNRLRDGARKLSEEVEEPEAEEAETITETSTEPADTNPQGPESSSPVVVWDPLSYEKLAGKLQRKHDAIVLVRIDPDTKTLTMKRALGVASATMDVETRKEIMKLLLTHPQIIKNRENT